jgi:hypothetical protein
VAREERTVIANLHRADIVIGGMAVCVRTASPSFARLLAQRYAGFLAGEAPDACRLDVEIHDEGNEVSDEDGELKVFRSGAGTWRMERGDFRAQWDPVARAGRVRQSANPYSIDSVLRIVHTLTLAGRGGFLVHAASAVRGGRGYVFAGASGAGKTTLSRLAPGDARLLSDEISYVCPEDGGYFAYGTPFAGEIGHSGDNIRAPLAAIYLLRQGEVNRIETIGRGDAVRGLLANILFFAHDDELVAAVFDAAVALAERVPVRRLTFRPEAAVWDLIGAPEEARA